MSAGGGPPADPNGGTGSSAVLRPGHATSGEIAILGILGLLALRVGLSPISDNSMLLHMRTGIDIVRTGHIPHSDAYSFTAAGHQWIVQSWLAEVTYGVAHRVAGFHGVVLEQGLLMAALALTIGLLARTGSTWRTLVTSGISAGAGVFLWSQRPLLFGLLGMALLILVVERRYNPLWLIPITWIWVNAHGSFPLAIAWLVARYVGAALDGHQRPRWLEPYAIALAAGLVVALVNPFGPKLLLFPLVVGRDQSVFKTIIEWKSPDFQGARALVFLLLFSSGLIFLLRRRPPWSDILPVVAFMIAGLFSERNLAVAAIVIAPALARAGRIAAGSATRPRRADGLPPVALPASLLAGIVLVAVSWRSAPLDLTTYPTAAQDFLVSSGLLTGHRMAAFDLVGDYEAFVQGPHQEVFIDDRYDMYPAAVVYDSHALQAGLAPSLDVLRKWRIDVVLWRKGEGPTDLLHLLGGWRQAWADRSWEILVKDPAAPATSP